DLRRLRHLRLHIINAEFTPSPGRIAGSGCGVREFRCAGLTCPQIKRDALPRPAARPVMTANHDGWSTQVATRIAPLPQTRLRHVGNCASKRAPRHCTEPW